MNRPTGEKVGWRHEWCRRVPHHGARAPVRPQAGREFPPPALSLGTIHTAHLLVIDGEVAGAPASGPSEDRVRAVLPFFGRQPPPVVRLLQEPTAEIGKGGDRIFTALDARCRSGGVRVTPRRLPDDSWP